MASAPLHKHTGAGGAASHSPPTGSSGSPWGCRQLAMPPSRPNSRPSPPSAAHPPLPPSPVCRKSTSPSRQPPSTRRPQTCHRLAFQPSEEAAAPGRSPLMNRHLTGCCAVAQGAIRCGNVGGVEGWADGVGATQRVRHNVVGSVSKRHGLPTTMGGKAGQAWLSAARCCVGVTHVELN